MRKFILLILVLGVAAAAGAATKKAKPKPTPEPEEESALGEEMGEALDKALASLESFKGAGEELDRRKISRATALRRFSEQRGKMASAIEKGRAAKPAEGTEAARDSFLVVASQGLKGMDLVIESVKSGDEDGEEKGWKLGELAYADLDALQSFEPGGSVGSGGGGGSSETVGIGQSVGFNANFSFASRNTSMGLNLSYSWPLTDSVDAGLGVNFGLNGSESPPTPPATYGTYNLSMDTGGNLFLRKHLLKFIPDKPWIVPFFGGTLGSNLNYSDSSALGSKETSTTSVTYGAQAGLLVFSNRNTAMSYQAQWENASSSTAGSTSSSTLSFAIGVRYML